MHKCTCALKRGKGSGYSWDIGKGKGKGDRGYNEKGMMKGVEMCAKRWRGKKRRDKG